MNEVDDIISSVEYKATQDKGNCLFLKNVKSFGEVVYRERALFLSEPSSETISSLDKVLNSLEDDLKLQPSWYAAAIMSLKSGTAADRAALDKKWYPHDKAHRIESKIIDSLNLEISPEELHKYLQIWRYNSFAHHSGPDSLAMYNYTSYMSHSCNVSIYVI